MILPLLLLFGSIIGISVLLHFYFKGKKTEDLIASHQSDTDHLKKYPEVDTTKLRPSLLLTGLIISVSCLLLAFAWSPRDEISGNLTGMSDYEDLEIEPPQTKQEKKPPPPPPPPKVEIVEDEVILEEDEPEIEDIEIDENTEIEEPIIEDDEVNEEEVFIQVEEMPSFPGGESAMLGYIYKNLEYPPIAVDNNIEGLVMVQFVVLKDGSIDAIKILRDIGGGCGKEAVRVVKSFPKWAPGKQRGKPVKVMFNLPVRFRLE